MSERYCGSAPKLTTNNPMPIAPARSTHRQDQAVADAIGHSSGRRSDEKGHQRPRCDRNLVVNTDQPHGLDQRRERYEPTEERKGEEDGGDVRHGIAAEPVEPRSNSGAGAVTTARQRPPSARDRATNDPITAADDQPHVSPCTMPSTRAPTPTPASGTLMRSTSSVPGDGGVSGSQRRPRTSATPMTGMLIKNTARHLNPSTSSAR